MTDKYEQMAREIADKHYTDRGWLTFEGYVDFLAEFARTVGAAETAALRARVRELEDCLTTVLPYIETAEMDPAYKPNVMRALVKRIRALLTKENSDG